MKAKWPDSDPEAVIFDLDGTLVDSMWMWTDIDIEYLARFGHPFSRQLQIEIEGMSIEETAVWFKQKYQIPDSLEQIRRDWISMSLDKYKNEVPFKPYARDFLCFLKSRGIKTAIASSNAVPMVEACLDSLSVKDQIDIVVTSSEVEKGKPWPDVYLLAAERLGADPSRCVVFEDVPAGIRAGKAAGMYVYAVYDKYSEDIDIEKRELADAYIHDFGELLPEKKDEDAVTGSTGSMS